MGKDLHMTLASTPFDMDVTPPGLAELIKTEPYSQSGLHAPTVLRIATAALNADRFEAEEALRSCIDAGFSAEDLIDHYIPEVARLLGDGWCVDHLGFAEVTIGVARLQGHVRMLDQRTKRREVPATVQPSVLLCVAPNCFHTLGPLIALSQFRRLGASVRLLLTQTADDLGEALANSPYDVIALTATAHERLEVLREFVDIVRNRRDSPPPIVVGGSILDLEPETHILVGADYAARTPHEALTLCGLTTPTYDADSCVRKV